MVKRDLDINIIREDISYAASFDLSQRLAEHLNPLSIFYRNTKIAPVEGRPENGIYWGFITKKWQIDCWILPEKWVNESKEYCHRISRKITPWNRLQILRLKHDLLEMGQYKNNINSKTLYKSVLEDDIHSAQEIIQRYAGRER